MQERIPYWQNAHEIASTLQEPMATGRAIQAGQIHPASKLQVTMLPTK